MLGRTLKGTGMSIKTFNNGSVLYTGDDIYKAFEQCWNRRDNYKKSCHFCKHNGSEDGSCDGCSVANDDMCCSCHINPPCAYCVNSNFEVTEYLINFKNYQQGKSRWECFPTTKEVFEKFKVIENSGYILSAEILSTGEIAIYIDKEYLSDLSNIRESIDICRKVEFKQHAVKMIKEF